MKTNLKIGLITGAALIIGYVSGSFIGWPNTGNALLSGDIGKVSRYSRTSTEEIKALQERMQTDKNFREDAMLSYALLDVHLESFASIVKLSSEATKGLPEFKSFNERFSAGIKAANSMSELSKKTVEGIAKLAEGKNSPEYEQLSANTTLAYMQTSTEMRSLKEFIAKTDEFLDGRKVSDYKKLAFARDQWVTYMLYDAALKGEDAEFEYWNSCKPLTDEKTVEEISAGMTNGEKRVAFSPIAILSCSTKGASTVNKSAKSEASKFLTSVLRSSGITTASEKLAIKDKEKMGSEALSWLGHNSIGMMWPINIPSREKIDLILPNSLSMVFSLQSLSSGLNSSAPLRALNMPKNSQRVVIPTGL